MVKVRKVKPLPIAPFAQKPLGCRHVSFAFQTGASFAAGNAAPSWRCQVKLTIQSRRYWKLSLAAAVGLLPAAPALAVDKSVAACMAESASITGTDEGINGGVDAATEAADVGLPVMDVGIVLGENQINANLSDMMGPLTEIAKSTCDTNDTLSTSANVSDFVGWTEAEDTEPQPALIPMQIDGTRSDATPFARTVDEENTATIRTMELDLKDGYAPALTGNETEGLANMEGMGLTGIESEKLALVAAGKDLEKLKAAGNMKDLVAMQAIVLNHMFEAIMRSNIISQQQEVGAAQRALFDVNQRKMYQDDHLAVSKMLKVGA